MALPTVYVETSIIGYLRARHSTLIPSAARQIATRRWWDEERHNYQLVVSPYVVNEASRGSPTLAGERLAAMDGIPRLEITDEIAAMADRLLASALLPPKARLDALHICTAAYHGIDYLLTWNCVHIANARILPRIRNFLSGLGYELPVVCTPEEMIDDPNHGNLDFE